MPFCTFCTLPGCVFKFLSLTGSNNPTNNASPSPLKMRLLFQGQLYSKIVLLFWLRLLLNRLLLRNQEAYREENLQILPRSGYRLILYLINIFVVANFCNSVFVSIYDYFNKSHIHCLSSTKTISYAYGLNLLLYPVHEKQIHAASINQLFAVALARILFSKLRQLTGTGAAAKRSLNV